MSNVAEATADAASADEWLTPDQAAVRMKVCRDTVLALFRAGRIPGVKMTAKIVRIDGVGLARLLREGGVKRSAATRKRRIRRPVAGKT